MHVPPGREERREDERLNSMRETTTQALLAGARTPRQADHTVCSCSPEPEAWASSCTGLVGQLSADLKGKDILDQRVPKHKAGAGLSVTQEDLKEENKTKAWSEAERGWKSWGGLHEASPHSGGGRRIWRLQAPEGSSSCTAQPWLPTSSRAQYAPAILVPIPLRGWPHCPPYPNRVASPFPGNPRWPGKLDTIHIPGSGHPATGMQ